MRTAALVLTLSAFVLFAACGDESGPQETRVVASAEDGLSWKDLAGGDAFWNSLSDRQQRKLIGIYQRGRGGMVGATGAKTVRLRRFDPRDLISAVDAYYAGGGRADIERDLNAADRKLMSARLRAAE
jgi:hypothetical protein